MRKKRKILSQAHLSPPCSIAYVTTFPPRACGIATFTEDLTNAIDNLFAPAIKTKIVAMNAHETDAYRYPEKVIYQICESDKQNYIDVAEKINADAEIQLVNVQHEFGIFGGKYGAHLFYFLKALKKPVVISCHTVLPRPNPALRDTVKKLANFSDRLIPMTMLAKSILMEDYDIPEEKLTVIPHGIHQHAYLSSSEAKKKYQFPNQIILSTFGLLSRGKGIEYVIGALPQVIKQFPSVTYYICGMTHPNILKKEGEAYRNSLVKLAKKLGVEKHVKFYNEYLSLADVLKFLEVTDIYISTSLNPNQAVSGTLSYALGTGRPIVSTAFSQAKELITEDVGKLVPFEDSNAYATAIIELLHNKQNLIDLGLNAYHQTRFMIWPNVALHYMHTFSELSKQISEMKQYKHLPPIKIDHFQRLTDDFGMFQFAKFTEPEIASGYTLDDNARALIAIVLFYARAKQHFQDSQKFLLKRPMLKLMETYLNVFDFVAKPDGTFENYVTPDRKLDHHMNERDSLEDSNGRALHALAIAATNRQGPKFVRERSTKLLRKSLQNNIPFTSPRAISFFIKALCYLIDADLLGDEFDLRAKLQEHTDHLVALFDTHAKEGWHWFEPYLTYANAIMPEALIFSYHITKNNHHLSIAMKTTNFLIDVHFDKGIYIPIGQDGWYHKDGKRYEYDQQPEDTASMVQLLAELYHATKETTYRDLMRNAFGWFLGNNSIKQIVYDQTSGGCCDGISPNGVNLNQGAESTVSYLIARLQFSD